MAGQCGSVNGGDGTQSHARHRKLSDGGPGHMLQPAGMGGAQTRPGRQPNVRSEPGGSGACEPVGAAQSVTLVVDAGAVTVVAGSTTVGATWVTVSCVTTG